MNEEKDIRREDEWGMQSRKFRIFPALLLICAGLIWTLQRSGVLELPRWIMDFSTIIILVGLLGGIKHRFRPGFWILPVLIGGLLMSRFFITDFRPQVFIGPIVLIAVGFLILLKPRGGGWRQRRLRRHQAHWNQMSSLGEPRDAGDVIEATAVFGGVKKRVMSKNFRGGDLTSFFGGCEIDLRQADFEGEILLESTNIMGGTKLIVPANWNIQSDVTCIFGGVDDKRDHTDQVDPNKKLRLDGTCVMGGIEIRSF